jgi:hypothetical protein
MGNVIVLTTNVFNKTNFFYFPEFIWLKDIIYHLKIY